jgi:hypothetical protein
LRSICCIEFFFGIDEVSKKKSDENKDVMGIRALL